MGLVGLYMCLQVYIVFVGNTCFLTKTFQQAFQTPRAYLQICPNNLPKDLPQLSPKPPQQKQIIQVLCKGGCKLCVGLSKDFVCFEMLIVASSL